MTPTLHEKEEVEQNASDEGGQAYSYSPPHEAVIEAITTLNPTGKPTTHPTAPSEPFVVKGTIWYDRNANNNRDSGIAMKEYGSDVEYELGLGGVKVTLAECDATTNREIKSSSESLAATMSQGYNIKMEPMLSSGGGVYRLINVKVGSYAVKVDAPNGYLFTSGICNDNERGWECEYYNGSNKRMLKDSTDIHSKESAQGKKMNTEYALGITSGRSIDCITVSDTGIPDKELNFGVLRIGDNKVANADVALVLEFDDDDVASNKRLLKEMVRDAVELARRDEDSSTVRRYLIDEKDKKAIGSVTAEVLASQLDKRLEENGVVLGSVAFRDVILSKDSETAHKNEVAVALNIMGHYTPPPFLDFDMIVSDSINSNTDEIRRDLKEYNKNCREQTEAYSKESSSNNNYLSSGHVVHSTVCAEGDILPTIFETSLKEISATKMSEIGFAPITYYDQEVLAAWALGPVAAVCGLIAIMVGMLIFRRAFPRKITKYDQLQRNELESQDVSYSHDMIDAPTQRRRSFVST